VAIGYIINDPKAVQDVQGGKTALSAGYTCDLERAPVGSKWCGMQYDFIQRNIRYNHVAIVDQARAGDEAKIRLDSADVELSFQVSKNINKEDPMKTIRLDGVDYQAEAKVIETLTQSQSRADVADAKVTELTGKLSAMEADRDAQKDRADGLAKDLEQVKADSMDDAKLEAVIQSKLQLRDTARKLGVEKLDGLSDLDIKKAAILKVTPKANLEGKDGAYIQARFDSTLEMVADAADADTRAAGAGPAAPVAGGEHHDKGDTRSPSEQARDRHHADQANRWQRNPKEVK
jgi:hypothetical protein